MTFTPEEAAFARQFIEQQGLGKLMATKTIVGDLATKMRNFALGDYGAKRNIVESASWVFPYITWYCFHSRTGFNG